MPGVNPGTVLALGSVIDSRRYSSLAVTMPRSGNLRVESKSPWKVGPWFFAPSSEWHAIQP